jgi:hypothetical protein
MRDISSESPQKNLNSLELAYLNHEFTAVTLKLSEFYSIVPFHPGLTSYECSQLWSKVFSGRLSICLLGVSSVWGHHEVP